MLEYEKTDILFLHLNKIPAFEKVLPSKLFEYAATGKPILAGVSGYSASFIKEEIPNATLFQPCNAHDAAKAFRLLKKKYTDRSSFIEKYSRDKISKEMASDISNFLDINK